MAKKQKVPQPGSDGILRTGIYQRSVGKLPKLSGDEMEAGLDRMVEEGSKAAQEQIAEIRGWLKPIVMAVLEGPLEKDKTSPAPGAAYRNLDLGEGPQIFLELPIEAGSVKVEQARNAIEALDKLRGIEHNLDGNHAFLLRSAVRLGRLIERIEIRVFEPATKTGRTVLKAVSLGGRLNAKLSDSEKKEIFRKVNHRVQTGESQTSVCKEVCKEYDAGWRTIERAWKEVRDE